MTLNEYLTVISKAVGKTLDEMLPPPEGSARLLAEAMRYSVFNGGKRLRPALFCATLEIFDRDYTPYLPYAAAIEMIHCYSLIHDDLPAMDDDLLRRGQPTCHIAFSEAMAILAGDGLLSLAGEILARPLSNVPPARQMAAAAEIMADAGHMVRGQAIELSTGDGGIDCRRLEEIYEGKTAALFRAAVMGAACLAGADARQMAALGEYSSALGLAFQITDDILDIKGQTALVGKPTGSDAKNDKLTYAALLGCEEAAIEARAAADKALTALAYFGQEAGMLRLYPGFFVSRQT